ncbi:MAG: hypothetical protein SFZ03_07000 [Candidatus Melainabacteria bacterium]|nr:hypothetical protein [Candidatus Melainabacteria bacterium]
MAGLDCGNVGRLSAHIQQNGAIWAGQGNTEYLAEQRDNILDLTRINNNGTPLNLDDDTESYYLIDTASCRVVGTGNAGSNPDAEANSLLNTILGLVD